MHTRMAPKKKEDAYPADEELHATKAEQPAPTPTKPATFKGKVNKYAFIHLDKSIREAWGITKGTEQPISIELTAEGNLVIRKA